MRVVHHDVDEDGHEEGEDRRAVAHLVPVDLAIPGRAAVDDLVAKDVELVEDEAKNADGVPLLEGSPEAALRGPKPSLPVLEPGHSAVILPEGVILYLLRRSTRMGPGKLSQIAS